MSKIRGIFLFLNLTIAASLLALWSPPGKAADTKPEARSLAALSTELDKNNKTFTGRLQPGFHFNYEAPNQMTVDGKKIEPIGKEPRRIQFSLLKDGSLEKAQAQVYVCDDAQTFCESLTIAVKTASSVALLKDAPKSGGIEKPAASSQGSHLPGFLEDAAGFEKGLALAKEKKQLLFLNFSAVWCPGCIRLKKEIYPKPAFRELSKNYVKVYLDVDKFENRALADEFGITVIPALVVIDPNRKEISRELDFLTMPQIKKFFADVKRNPETHTELEERAKSDPALYNLLGERLSRARKAAESFAAFEKAEPKSPIYLDTKVRLAKEELKNKAASEPDKEKAKEKYSQALVEAISLEPWSARALGWRADLQDLQVDILAKEKIRDEGRLYADLMLADAKALKRGFSTEVAGEYAGFERFLVGELRARLFAGVKKEDGIPAWKDAVKIMQTYKAQGKHVPSGAELRYYLGLVQAKELEQAERVLNKLIQSEPQNYDLLRRKTKLLVEQKKFAEAVAVGEKALANSYGQLEFYVARELAKAQIQNGQKDQANLLLKKYLAREELTSMESMKSIKEELEALAKTI